MNTYEQLAENLKIRWIKDFDFTNKKYTQVSGYIFNEQNELLIVKNGKAYVIPGGHPEVNETSLDTLIREIYEEAYIEIKDIKYLGAVEVVENNETYYQLRYTAKVNELKPFKQEWEIGERKFVKLEDLPTYIKWSKGITFSAQIESAKKFWKM